MRGLTKLIIGKIIVTKTVNAENKVTDFKSFQEMMIC